MKTRCGGAVWPAFLVILRRIHTTGMQSKVHPTYKTKYRVANWAAYNQALVRRGDVTVWLSSEAVAAWTPGRSGRRGGQRRYSDLAIETAMTGSSPADAIRHWSAEGGHPIQDLTAEDGLTPVRLEFPILSLNPRLRQRCVAPDVWPTLSRA